MASCSKRLWSDGIEHCGLQYGYNGSHFFIKESASEHFWQEDMPNQSRPDFSVIKKGVTIEKIYQ